MVSGRVFRALSVLVLAAVVAAGCGSGDDDGGGGGEASGGSSEGGGGEAPDRIIISTPGSLESPVHSAFWVAQGSGAFDAVEEEFGTTIEFQSFGTGSDTLTALLGGSVQACNCGTATTLKAVAQGQDLVFGATSFVGGGVVVVGRADEEESRGADLGEYDGATLGYTSEGSTSQIFSELALEHAGVDDFEGVAVGNLSAMIPALEGERIDLAAMDLGGAAAAITAGDAYIVFNFNDPEQYEPVLGDILGNGLVFQQEFADQYPELVDALDAALIDSLQRLHEAEDATTALELYPDNVRETYADEELWEQTWDAFEPAITANDGGYPAEAVQATVDVAVAGGTLTDDDVAALEPKLDAMFDEARVDAAYERLGTPRPEAP